MDTQSQLLTVALDGTRYRGAYSLEHGQLIVEAHGLGRKNIDASIIDYAMGEPARKLATIVFTQLIKESVHREDDLLHLATQGTTTQVALIGSPA